MEELKALLVIKGNSFNQVWLKVSVVKWGLTWILDLIHIKGRNKKLILSCHSRHKIFTNKCNQVLHVIHLVIALSSVNYIFIGFIVKNIYFFKYCYSLSSPLFSK